MKKLNRLIYKALTPLMWVVGVIVGGMSWIHARLWRRVAQPELPKSFEPKQLKASYGPTAYFQSTYTQSTYTPLAYKGGGFGLGAGIFNAALPHQGLTAAQIQISRYFQLHQSILSVQQWLQGLSRQGEIRDISFGCAKAEVLDDPAFSVSTKTEIKIPIFASVESNKQVLERSRVFSLSSLVPLSQFLTKAQALADRYVTISPKPEIQLIERLWWNRPRFDELHLQKKGA